MPKTKAEVEEYLAKYNVSTVRCSAPLDALWQMFMHAVCFVLRHLSCTLT